MKAANQTLIPWGEIDTGVENPHDIETLCSKWIVPPFSVLDSRQHYWQKRKKSWLNLGIESELGRGETLTYGISPSGTDTKDGTTAWTDKGRSKLKAKLKDCSPGGSPRPAANYKNQERGDGAGRPLARCFGEDIMKGENKNFAKGQPVINACFNRDETAGGKESSTGTSIFDPCLTEICYQWFCPPKGHILDPFCGGSVRGIVASVTGRSYTGIDLSERQIIANREQAEKILFEPLKDELVTVTVSGKMLRQMFHPCEPQYIKTVCHGRCCEGTDHIMVTIHPSETDRIISLGGKIENGFLQADERGLCPFKTDEGLCKIHGDQKPYGCRFSPFTLTPRNTLIVRNRYRLLRCAKGSDLQPAYISHRWSLEQIFGKAEAERIAHRVEAGQDAISAHMPRLHHQILLDNDAIKHGVQNNRIPTWIQGDAADVLTLAGCKEFDFIFSCPPYFDLEKYSDDPRDLSNMSWPEFLLKYRQIIKDSVSLLKPNRFAAFVVGNVRSKKRGVMRDLVGETIGAFEACGCWYFNEGIFINAIGSLPVRVNKQMLVSRKLGKGHQNVLVFVKGNYREAVEAIGNEGINGWPYNQEA